MRFPMGYLPQRYAALGLVSDSVFIVVFRTARSLLLCLLYLGAVFSLLLGSLSKTQSRTASHRT